MLELYREQFEDIVSNAKGRRKTMLLSNLMTQMESYYKLSALKEIFERETDLAVQELYLSVANARNF